MVNDRGIFSSDVLVNVDLFIDGTWLWKAYMIYQKNEILCLM